VTEYLDKTQKIEDMPWKHFHEIIDLPSIGLMIFSIAAIGSVIGLIAGFTTVVYNAIRIKDYLKNRNKKTHE
jgi:hypothetical protein